MKIAVCDDNEIYLKALLNIMGDIVEPNDRVDSFSNGNDLLALYDKADAYDLIILDIKMPGLTGLEVAQEIRLIDEDAYIVLLTRYGEYALEAYSVHPYDFIIKPVNSDKLLDVLRKVRSKLPRPETIAIKTEHGLLSISISSIYAVEVFHTTLLFYTADGDFKSTGRIKEICQKLTPFGFFQIHKSIVVNLSWIRYVDIENSFVVVEGQKKFQIAARRKSEFMGAFKCRGQEWAV